MKGRVVEWEVEGEERERSGVVGGREGLGFFTF